MIFVFSVVLLVLCFRFSRVPNYHLVVLGVGGGSFADIEAFCKSTGKSTFFHVKDVGELKNWMERIMVTVVTIPLNGQNDHLLCVRLHLSVRERLSNIFCRLVSSLITPGMNDIRRLMEQVNLGKK